MSTRNPTSQFLTISNRHFLIDCGEGTQIQLRKNKIGFGRIKHIFISHLHGDHFYGLVPLLSSLQLLDREAELHIYAPPGLEQGVYDLLKLSRGRLRYPVIFHELNMKERELVYEDKAVEVFSFPLRHSIPCCGFLFREKTRPRNFKKEMLEKYSIPVAEIRKIKQGADWQDEAGNTIKNEELTTPPSEPLSYAFCTDTLPLKNLNDLLQTSPTLLYHEATFTDEHQKRAKKTLHTTARQAAEIARQVNANYLLIGHFSIRYENLDELLGEAKEGFSDTYLARENCTFTLKGPNNLIAESRLP